MSPLVTAVAEGLAKEGFVFTCLGPAAECGGCRLKNACQNLARGRRYRLVGLRDATHPCAVSEGRIRVVEVEAADLETSVPSRLAIEGSTVKFETKDCGYTGCATFLLCNPQGVKEGEKYRVVSAGGTMECPAGLKLVRCTLGPEEG